MDLPEFLAHPAAVHVPLALAVLFPLFYLATLWATLTNWLPMRLWSVLWWLGLVQITSTMLAYLSGEKSKFLSAAAQEQILAHERLGLVLVVLWFFILTFLTVILSTKQKIIWNTANALLIGLLLTQLVIAFQLGKIGGALVPH